MELTGMLTAIGLLEFSCEVVEVLQSETIVSNLLSIESKWLFIQANSDFTVASWCKASLRSFVILVMASLTTWSMTGYESVLTQPLPLSCIEVDCLGSDKADCAAVICLCGA